MSAMAALQSSFTTLSLSSTSFFGQRLSPALIPPQARPIDQPCPIVMKLKRWERKKCKPNSLPILQKVHVKIGDTVKIIAGRDKGKIGEITEIFKHNSKVVVKDINLKTKHVKTNKEDKEDETEKQKGQIIKVEAPVHSSNVMLYSKEQNVASRVGHKILENGSRVRYLIKTGEIIDSVEIWKKVIKEKTTTEVAVASPSS
ncbi:50S ribosomal protein L24, chloroplastic [Impatiens glandulifera]|uniref:50S ribosomal protein L24, chloroplastic n=1 Tax=Impatiens glandulifera TaxID=253017 RepID=UPI001FB10B26|nr:50S ribosomal protein L24, chloroplastic [Impatiens glandulifera]